jgi:hypothetical protein
MRSAATNSVPSPEHVCTAILAFTLTGPLGSPSHHDDLTDSESQPFPAHFSGDCFRLVPASGQLRVFCFPVCAQNAMGCFHKAAARSYVAPRKRGMKKEIQKVSCREDLRLLGRRD